MYKYQKVIRHLKKNRSIKVLKQDKECGDLIISRNNYNIPTNAFRFSIHPI